MQPMPLYLVPLVLGILLAVPGLSARDEPQRIRWTDESGMECLLILPEVPAGTRLPLVLYLHGYTENPHAHEPWIVPALASLEPCAVFIPLRPAKEGSSAWGGTYQGTLSRSLRRVLKDLDGLLQQYPIDPERQYVYGGSMGAEGVMGLLAWGKNRFAGAVAVAGYTTVDQAPAMAGTWLWLIHGSADTVNATESSRNIYRAIQDAGGTRVRYTEYPGVDHGTVWNQVTAEPGLLAWLLSRRHGASD